MTIRMKQYLITALIGLAALIVVFPSQASQQAACSSDLTTEVR